MNDVILIRGSLGVGKSTVAKSIAQTLGGVYFSVDQTLSDHQLDQNIPPNSDGIPVERFLQVHDILQADIEAALAKHMKVVIDGNVYYREQLDDLERRYPGRVRCFTLQAPLEICIARDAARARVYGVDAAAAVFMMVDRIKIGESVDATGSVEETTKQILKLVQS